jgi:hypothetical protein
MLPRIRIRCNGPAAYIIIVVKSRENRIQSDRFSPGRMSTGIEMAASPMNMMKKKTLRRSGRRWKYNIRTMFMF